MTTIAHISDLHFGRIAHPGIVARLVREVNAPEVDLVVLSGDLTQRARVSEFEAARAMLDAIDPPTMVVPGNHDVYPWWHPVRRLAMPLKRYRTYVSADLTPTVSIDGTKVLGINSAHGATIKGGRVTEAELTAIRRHLGVEDDATFKVLVLHHHLTKIRALGRHDVAWKSREALDVAADAGVDLILCGHLHVSHIEPVEIVPASRRIVVVSAGTATSNRGRRSNQATNFYNRVTIDADAFAVEERRYVPADDCFVRDSRTTFDREERAKSEEGGATMED
jgi:3',5'-cyclic AMP phosphodiesterase CpdA